MEEFQKIETDIRQMNFCASTSPSGSLSTQKDLADIQFSYQQGFLMLTM
jgi:hypothetical protein